MWSKPGFAVADRRCFRTWCVLCFMINKLVSFFSWNVRGLGQPSRCDDVLCELIATRPTFACLQETKLEHISLAKRKSFLPVRLSSCSANPSDGASGGILTAWDADVCTLTNEQEHSFFRTSTFRLNADGSSLHLTNVYAPMTHADKPLFLSELTSLANSISGPWIIIGDFNLTRSPDDKNSRNFCHSEADTFNSVISNLALVELPLVDRSYTWSNRRDDPALVRLDRCFVNTDWDSTFPNSNLFSRERFTSDHIPLVVSASTQIPHSSCFRFENAWMKHPTFVDLMNSTLLHSGDHFGELSFSRCLKHCCRNAELGHTACLLWTREKMTQGSSYMLLISCRSRPAQACCTGPFRTLTASASLTGVNDSTSGSPRSGTRILASFTPLPRGNAGKI